MKEALQHAAKSIKFIGSSWSPPAWMKNNGQLNHGGQLIGEAGSYEWKQYARYLLKYFSFVHSKYCHETICEIRLPSDSSKHTKTMHYLSGG